MEAQQAAEKTIKALYIFYKIEPPRTHNFVVLLNALKEEVSISDEIANVIELNDYAVQTRYPVDYTTIEVEIHRF